jgi:hypothetical protein
MSLLMSRGVTIIEYCIQKSKNRFFNKINLIFDWKIVERLVLEQIRNFIVLPNKISVPLSANIPIKGKKSLSESLYKKIV